MFNNDRYLTCGIENQIALKLQMFIWNLVDQLPESRDYLQVFELVRIGDMQGIIHSSENPEYHMEYLFPSDTPITEKLYVIDDGSHSIMLLAEEY